ncbi:MAG: type II toxin-antitoxin system ParD family antitoxin [Bryobacteraceae bacterium]
MNIELSREIEQLVESKIRSGRFQSASDVVAEAVRLMDETERADAEHLADLQRRLDEDLAALDRGEGLDGEAFMAEMLAELDARHARG